MTTSAHQCSAKTLKEVTASRTRARIGYTCTGCGRVFDAFSEMDTTAGTVRWFAARRSQALVDLVKSGDFDTNLAAMAAATPQPPLHDLWIFVETVRD